MTSTSPADSTWRTIYVSPQLQLIEYGRLLASLDSVAVRRQFLISAGGIITGESPDDVVNAAFAGHARSVLEQLAAALEQAVTDLAAKPR
jgi:uncharacterized protein YuzB (UPF0349 family)